jgi:hypothetical protein
VTDNKNNNTTSKTSPQQQKFIDEQAAIVKANRLLTIRLALAQAFHSMWIRAYDALLHHQVNVRDLPEYKDSKLLDKALESDLEKGQGLIVDYLKKVESGINAAVRRKSFRKV